MKILTMFSGKEFIIDSSEAESIQQNFNSNTLIQLKSGETINPKGIESIQEHTLKEWNGHKVYQEKTGRMYFTRDGEKISLGDDEIKEIKTTQITDKKLLN